MRSRQIIVEIIWNIYWKIRTHSCPIHQSFSCERLRILLCPVRQNFSCGKLQSQLCRFHQNFFSQMHWTWLCRSRRSFSFRKCSHLNWNKDNVFINLTPERIKNIHFRDIFYVKRFILLKMDNVDGQVIMNHECEYFRVPSLSSRNVGIGNVRDILDSCWECANLPHGVKTLSLWKGVSNFII